MNKLMEYMALGKAVVAYDLPETRVSGGNTIAYVEGETSEALAAAILRLVDNPVERNKLGEQARRRVEDSLCWERQAASLREVYRGLLTDCSASGRSNRQMEAGSSEGNRGD